MSKVVKILKHALTTTNASDIGIMYIVVGVISLIIGSIDAALIRDQLTFNNISAVDYYTAVSLHGIIMIFFMVMPISVGFANYLVPRMIGANDLYWPKINALSFWILVPSVFLVFIAPLFGPIDTGWYMYAPLSTELSVNGGFGVDLVEIGLMVAGVSSTLTGINFIMTITKLRKVPYSKMTLFAWSMFATSILLFIALPPLTAGLVMAFLERNWGLNFFNAAAGGNPVLWQHIFWFFGHPEVYILVLPAMGLVSELIQRAAARRRLYGYMAVALSSMAIAFLSSFTVWMHHMLTAIFNEPIRILASSMTMAIALPSGIKVFNWTVSLYNSRLRITTPGLLALGFVVLFLVGGITGVFLPQVPIDYAVNGTYFIVGHFHYMVGAILIALLGGLFYYFPHFTGRRYDENLGNSAAILLISGFFILSTGMSIDGALGMPRRYAVVPLPQYQPFQDMVTVGGVLVGVGMIMAFANLLYSYFRGEKVTTTDPWNVESIELPDFAIKPVKLPLTFGKAMDGSEPEHHHGSYYPSILGLLMVFPPLGFLALLHGILPLGLFFILSFIGAGFAWMYNDYFKGMLPPSSPSFNLPSSHIDGGIPVNNNVVSNNSVSTSVIVSDARRAVLLFIIAEVTLFGSFIGGYLFVQNFTPTFATIQRVPIEVFPLPVILTIILLSSSIPAHLAHHELMKGNLKAYKILGALTFVMGFTFLMGQVYEFTHLIEFTPQLNAFTTFFFSIVNLHAFHVIMGLTLWAFTLFRARKIPPYAGATATTYYWHFVDAIWVIVFTMLYLSLY